METNTVCEVQELNLRLIELASFNSFNGEQVASDLRANRDLWTAVLIDRESYNAGIDQIKLRDLPNGYWNVDTLMVAVPHTQVEAFRAMAQNWGPDEFDEVSWEPGCGLDPRCFTLFRLWWD